MAEIEGSLARDPGDYGRSAFFAMLTRDDRGSVYHFASDRRGGGDWRAERALPAGALAGYAPPVGRDCFVTPNGFARGSRSRDTNRLRQVNVLKYDVDFHGGGDVDYLVALGLALLEASWRSGGIPVPSMVVDSGRGLHLYYSLERSTSYRLRGGAVNERGLKYLQAVDERLASAIGASLAPLAEAKLDRSVSDLARVMRLPGTVNQGSGRMCRVTYDSGATHTPASLMAELPAPDSPRVAGARRRVRMLNFDKLSMSRMAKVEQLQDLRGRRCRGTRELMCFVYYNAAVQVYNDRGDAYDALEAFNERFVERISKRELEGVRKSVDKVGFYKIGAGLLTTKFLQMSADEIEEVGFFESSKETQRQAAKRRTAEKRAARDARIVELYREPGATYESVAGQVGCSRRTVASVLRKEADALQQRGADTKRLMKEVLNQREINECKKMPHVFSCSARVRVALDVDRNSRYAVGFPGG